MERWSRGRRLIALVASCACVGLAACGASGPVTVRWSPMPTTALAAGTVRVLDIAAVPGGWIAVGSITTSSRMPGAWRSSDLSHWVRIPTAPISFYGARTEFITVASGPRGIVAFGGAPGGAHDNPRVASWYLDGATLREVPALFELYGGERQGTVTQAAAAGAGFVLIGDRTDTDQRFGAAAWSSRDGRTAFTVDDGDPALESTSTSIVDALGVSGGPGGFIAVGERLDTSGSTLAVHGAVWRSPDGARWSAVESPAFGSPGDRIIQQAAPFGGGWVLAGTATLHGDTHLVTWSSTPDGRWVQRDVADLGRADVTSVVTDLRQVGHALVLAGRLGPNPELAVSNDGQHWRALVLPPGIGTDPHQRLVVAGDSQRLGLVSTADGPSRMWIAAGGPP